MSQIRTILIVLVVLFFANLLLAPWAQAQGDLGSRAAKRESSRWTLQEWLAQRDRNRMMDLWLSMNSPSPFEFALGGSYLSSATKIDNPASEEKFDSYAGDLHAYAQFVGLTVEYANRTKENFSDLSGMLNIRLLGDSLQNSSLTVSFGQRSRSLEIAGASVLQRNLFGQVGLQMYLSKYFGLDSHYRQYQTAADDATGDDIGGSQAQVGLFIDFKAVRIFGAWTRDRQTNVNSSSETNTIREGIVSGLRIYY